MNRIITIILLMLASAATGHATHNRAGQILYRHISGNTYEFTITAFYYSFSPATEQRIESGLSITWGDNHVSQIPCENVEQLPDNYTRCLFRMQHTFPGPGVYTVIMADPNRNVGVQNIPNSDAVQFGVKTIVRIDPNTGHNNAPEFLNYPIDKAAVGQRFVHNPSAYDIDGDSLSYELGVCLREQGIEIETYRLPEASNRLYVDEITGDFVWDAPVEPGIYNVAIWISEWRYGIKIGTIMRDMQIEVVDSDNHPPELPPFKDTCLIAGSPELIVPFRATDPDGDSILVTATGGPFQVPVHPAKLTIGTRDRGFTDATFSWQTDYSHVRQQKYTVSFKAEDQNAIKLVTFAGYSITVIAPPVELQPAVAEKKEIRLAWSQTPCEHATGYEIWRSISNRDISTDPCSAGIPAGSGYEKVGDVQGITNTTFNDNNAGRGLSPGIIYCYRIVVAFADGARSKPSNETCASLLAGTPPIILADVETISSAGAIHIKWLEKPVKMRLADKPGPFEYRLFHSLSMDAPEWTQLATNPLGDTTFVHEPIDTRSLYPHYYKVELWETGGNIVDEDSEIASTLYPVLQPSDNAITISFGRYTPWVNSIYNIYRCTKTGADPCVPTEFIGRTDRETYTDNAGLSNGQEYCYLIRSEGYRNIDGVEYRNENRSHVACATPFDNVPPCAPELAAASYCDNSQNILTWEYPTAYPAATDCWYDVARYRIWFSPDPARHPYTAIDSVMSRDLFTYTHTNTLVGCYYVTAVDTAGNQSPWSNTVCLDQCGEYSLPNVFTPNGDNINDVFKSYNPGGVQRVDMRIYNRHGKLVYKTEDADINWDGRDIDTRRFVASGVYYYTCTVNEERLTGSRSLALSGFIHVYFGKEAQPYTPPIVND